MSSHADSGFGSGLREQIQRRRPAAPRRVRLVAVKEQTGDGSRRAEDVLAGDWFSAAGPDGASVEEKSREDQLAEMKARLEQVERDLAAAKADLADRDTRITDLQFMLETTYRQRDELSETLLSLDAEAVNQRTRLLTARRQILIAAAASFAVAFAIGRTTR